MWQGSYGKEPFNLRLTVLRMCCKLPWIVGLTLLGTVLFGGGYYVKNVLLDKEQLYTVTSLYRVEYAVEEEKDIGTVYINQASWNTYLRTESFLDAVQGHLAESSTMGGSKLQLTNEELKGMLSAILASDLRVPSTVVTADEPEMAIMVARAVEAAMTQEIAESIREITGVMVMDSPEDATEVIPDVRVGRALALSAILSCFFVTLFFLMKETWEDGIWLPVTLWKRYGVKAAGTLESVELAENLAYFFAGKGKVALCPISGDVDSARMLETLRERCPETVGEEWIAVPSPLMCPEVCRELRKCNGILLAVPAGAHVGKVTERVLELLEQQDCQVTAAILADADERLISGYYCGGFLKERE